LSDGDDDDVGCFSDDGGDSCDEHLGGSSGRGGERGCGGGGGSGSFGAGRAGIDTDADDGGLLPEEQHEGKRKPTSSDDRQRRCKTDALASLVAGARGYFSGVFAKAPSTFAVAKEGGKVGAGG
jgi:hypothetical protein